MASKQYISIIRLFHHCDIATGNDFNLSRAKKQLQAEFSIAQEGFIQIDGFTYNRHDVFEEIEHPDFSRRLTFHQMIWQRPLILQLLEKNTTYLPGIRDEFKAFWSNKEFDLFFSPYFARPFNNLSRTLLAETKMREAGDLLSYEDFLQPAEREEAFQPIRLFLEETTRTLRNVNRENYKIMRPKILHWIDTDWYMFLNHLPHEFYEKKNDITVLLINIGVAVQKTHRGDCRAMSEQLISLQDTPENIREVIVSNHAAYSGSPKSGSFSWSGAWWIGWVIFMLIRIVASDSCNDKPYKTNFPPIQYKYETLDSLLKKYRNDRNDSSNITTIDTSFHRKYDLPIKVDIVPDTQILREIN